jgi:hypothetical protein
MNLPDILVILSLLVLIFEEVKNLNSLDLIKYPFFVIQVSKDLAESDTNL